MRQVGLAHGDLDDPGSWRAWGGSDFDVRFDDPYLLPAAAPRGVACAPIDPESLGIMNQSVSYNTYLGRHVVVGTTALHQDGREVWGVLYAFSDDLIHWDDRQLLFEAVLPWTDQPGDQVYLLYPSLLDPDCPSRNLETFGKTVVLYFTRFSRPLAEPLDRDLVRIPLEFFETPEEAQAAAVPFWIGP